MRARSISLGADGKWSEYRHIEINQKVTLGAGEAILILVLGLLGVVIAIFGYFCLLRGYIARNRSVTRPADQPGLELNDFIAEPNDVVDQPADAQVELPRPFVLSSSQEQDDVDDLQDEDDVNLIQNR